MMYARASRALLALVAALAVLSVAAGVSVRVSSETTPEGTTATVNGKRVEPGDISDDTGKGSFRKTDHASHVEFSSTSSGGSASASARTSTGGGEGWSSGDEDEGEHCAYDTVTMSQRDGGEPVITRTHKEGCHGAKGGDAEAEAEAKARKKKSKFDRMMRRRRASAEATMQNLERNQDPLHVPTLRDMTAGGSGKADDWSDSEERAGGGGVEKDWGDMKARARAHGDDASERVEASRTTNADGTETKRVSASASASSSSRVKAE